MNLQTIAEIPTSIRRWKAYPAYKESGVEWVPKIPAPWEMQRLKVVLLEPLQYGANEEAGETDIASPRFVRITDINERGELRDDTFRSLAEEKAKPYLLADGDVLLARSGATVGKSFQYKNSWGQCCFAGYLIRARLDQKKCLPDFLKYFTSSTNYWDWIASSLIQATIQNVSAEKYGNLSLPLPQPPEQQAIISLLKRETAKIDALAAKKEGLIALLQEKRAALITRAVTKGLDPNVPMKESGVEWLGKIPAHWEVRKGRYLGHLLGGADPDAFEPDDESSIFYLKVDDLNRPGEGLYLCDGVDRVRAISENLHLPSGELILFPKRGAAIFTNKVRIVKGPVLFDSNIMGWHVVSSVNIKYLSYVLLARGLKDLADISSVPQINNKHIYPTSFPVPLKEEQQAIGDFLDEEMAKTDALIAKIREGIEKLKEYRTALISAAVTGKIDVREEVSL